MKKVLLAIAAIVIVLGVVLYFAAAPFLINKTVNKMRSEAGLTIKSVNIPDFKIVYAEGGTGDTIIMLHGFGVNKDRWLSFAKLFTPNYRVIIPDLPGCGDSSKQEDKNYNIMSQVERLNLFAKELKLTKFHLVGSSMGGDIAGNYAATYPEMVKTLALFDALGVITPIKSELTLLMEKGENPFYIKDVNSLNKYLEFVFVKPPQFPNFVKKYVAEQALKDTPFNEKIYKDMQSDMFILESKLDKITAPTLIVWGDSDKVIHISSVPIFEKGIKNSKSVIIKECGHVPMTEKPTETAAVYQDFLNGKN